MENKDLFAEFKAPSRADWEKTAQAEVGETKTIEALRWETPDGIIFNPIYSAEDTNDLSYLNSFRFHGVGLGSNARHWSNLPEVIVDDENAANALALEHLQSEADGIVFRLNNDNVDFKNLLKGIEWEYCNVSFISPSENTLTSLVDFVNASGLDKSKISGSWFMNSNIERDSLTDLQTGFKTLGISINESSPVAEIVEALKRGTQLIDRYLNDNHHISSIINHIAFNIPVGPLLLQEISKLKALRILWYQVARAYGADSFSPDDLMLHGRSEVWTNETFQPHGNMLKGTIAALAGITGGCNALTILPEDSSNKMMNRIARNVSVLLKEESHLGKVLDPVAGAYAIDEMVDKLCKESWDQFRKQIAS